MNTRSESAEHAAAMRARARDWAAGAAEAKEFDRRRAAGMTVDERLAEAVALTRIAERLRASVRPQDKADLDELEQLHGPLPILPIPGLDPPT